MQLKDLGCVITTDLIFLLELMGEVPLIEFYNGTFVNSYCPLNSLDEQK